MANDIFQTNINIGKGWKLDGAIINFGEQNRNILATSLTVNYNRGTEQINPINQNKRYTVASDPTGTIQIGAVVGPSVSVSAFVGQFGDVCKLDENQITISPSGEQNCPAGDDPESTFVSEDWIASGCLITGLSMTVQKTAGGNMVIAGMTISFLKLELKE